MNRELIDIIKDFRDIIKPINCKWLIQQNYEGKGLLDAAEFEKEFDQILDAAENFNWIPTYEDLPEQGQNVFVAWIDPRKPKAAQKICYDAAIYRYTSFCGFGLGTKTILAWMPIPNLHEND